MRFKKLHKNADFVYSGEGNAGYEFVLPEMVILRAGEQKKIKTGIVLEIPEGYYGEIKDRSGLASKKFLHTHAGVIDSSFCGDNDEIQVVMSYNPPLGSVFDKINAFLKMVIAIVFNPDLKDDQADNSLGNQVLARLSERLEPEPLVLEAGTRFAQIIFQKYFVFELEQTDRMQNPDRSGFGSTGET